VWVGVARGYAPHNDGLLQTITGAWSHVPTISCTRPGRRDLLLRGSEVHQNRLVFVGVIGAALVALVVAALVVPRVRARQQAGWLDSDHVTLEPVITGLREPTYVGWPPDGSGRAFVLERGGLIRVAGADGQLQSMPFLDLSQVVSLGTEEGLVGLAFDPNFAQNGHVYVDYTAKDWSINVVRYTASADHPDVVDPATAEVVLNIPKQSEYHQAGMLDFGPDGYLYVSVGDDNQSQRAQDLGVLTGKILRIDVDSGQQPYAIPSTNPFIDSDARGEIWAYGLRNPWRFSFDRTTGDMWIGDVHHIDDGPGSDNNWESVEFQPAGTSGLNYGFPMRATFHCADIASCRPPGVTLPVTQFDHNMRCSITGGYVYRGSAVPGLVGAYIFGDLCTGGIFAVRGSAAQPWSSQLELGYQPIKVSSFGEDPSGEVYVVDLQGGEVYRIADGSLH